jgi:hypothetical protein
MAKMRLDYTESQRQLAPDGEYSLRAKEKKQELSKTSKQPMITIDWLPFDPPPGVTMDQIDKCSIRTWVSLAPNALFTLKNLMHACGVQCECAGCGNNYDANLDACPNCGSALFEFDPDFIDTATPKALVAIEKEQKGEKDVNVIKKYFI